MKKMTKQKAFFASAAFVAVVFLGALNTDPEKEVKKAIKTAKAVEVDEKEKREEVPEEIQVASEPSEGDEAVLVDGGSTTQKQPTAKQSSKPAAVGSGKSASHSEQATAEKRSSDGAGQTGMKYTSQPSGTPQAATPSATPEVVEVKPVETPVVSIPAPAPSTPTPEVPEPTVVPEPAPATPAPTPVAPTPSQEPATDAPALDYSGATQEGGLTESQACRPGFFWNGTECVFN